MISEYRHQKISEANRQLIRDVSGDSSSKRASSVTFDTVVLAVEPVDSETPGRLHAETILDSMAHLGAVIPVVRQRTGHLCLTRRRNSISDRGNNKFGE